MRKRKNAFGRVKRGRAELRAFLAELFANTIGTGARDGLRAALDALRGGGRRRVHSYHESRGQRSPRGAARVPRRIHNTYVLAKSAGQ